ncbi:hypothetical protein [Rhodovulum sp. ES.010]|nr:hypothetical protein [Rhodovulum sp. ES.010]
MMEAEFGPHEGGRSFFARLHHRSDGYGLMAERGDFNALVLGTRWR